MAKKLCVFVALLFLVMISPGCEDEREQLRRENHQLRQGLNECQQRMMAFSKAMELVSQGDCANAVAVYQGVKVSEEDELKETIASYTRIILTVLIVVALGVMAIFLILAAVMVESFLEGLIRVITIVTGFLLYYGSKSIGVSVPSLMLSSIVVTNPLYFLSFGAVIPFFVGATASWYVIRKLKQVSSFAYRVAILVGVFLVTLFTDVFVVAFSSGSANSKVLVPNLAFILGVSLYVIFRYEVKTK